MKWEEFLDRCVPGARSSFIKAKALAEAKTLAEEAKYQVGKAGIKVLDAFAIRLATPNKTRGKTFFARFVVPNKLHFCFDRLVEERGFSERKKQELIGYLRDEGFWERDARGGAEEVEGFMNEDALEIFQYVLDEVAAELNLVSAGSRRPGARGGPGEGEAHRILKEYIWENPLSVGINLKGARAEIERNLPSGDKIDVSFENRTSWIGVEAKSDQSSEDDIRRGLYQCVKYRAVIEAYCAVEGIERNIRVLLALGGPFPQSLLREKNVLGIEVIDEIAVPS